MKKILLSGLSVCIFSAALINSVNAQQSGKAAELNYRLPVHTKQLPTNSRKSFLENYHLTEIRIKAVRHFTRSFKQAENVHWYKTDVGVVAYFTTNGMKTRAAYDKKGHWLYSIRSYAEAYLPKNVRDQVKFAFYDFNITWVNEITNSRQLAYFVQIEDKTSMKTVSICDGEMETVEEFVKQ